VLCVLLLQPIRRDDVIDQNWRESRTESFNAADYNEDMDAADDNEDGAADDEEDDAIEDDEEGDAIEDACEGVRKNTKSGQIETTRPTKRATNLRKQHK